MKTFATLTITGLALAATLTVSAMSNEEAAAFLVAQRHARVVAQPPAITLNEPASASLPTNIHSSVAASDVARIPLVLKADGFAVGLLKWTAPLASTADPVAGYEVRVVNDHPVSLVYTATATEFPFNVNMLTVAAYEYWQVRTVFASGRRSAWNVSKTFPENVTLAY